MAIRWTDSKIKSKKMPAGKADVRIAIRTGLYLRMRAGDAPSKPTKTFEYRAQINGIRRYLVLGQYSQSFGLADAEAKLAKLQGVAARARIGEADHPAIEERHQRKAKLADPTFDELLEEFVRDRQTGSRRLGGKPVRQRTIDIHRQNYDADIRGQIGQAKVSRIQSEALERCYKAALSRGSPGMAAQVFRTLRALIRYAIKTRRLTADPMAGLENPRPHRPPQSHAEVVAATDDELRALFRVLEESDVSESIRLAVELQLLTGARPTEVRLAMLPEFTMSASKWVLPAARTKSDRKMEIHLSPQAVEVVKAARKLPRLEPYLFPGARGAEMEKLAVARALARLEERMLKAGCRKLRPHDLRRTFRTMLSRLKVAPHIAELCLGHLQKDVLARVYDGYNPRPEMNAAWDAAGAHLAALKEGK